MARDESRWRLKFLRQPAEEAVCHLMRAPFPMCKHDDSLARPVRQAPGATLAVVIVAMLGPALTSGCALAPSAAPAPTPICAAPAPLTAPSAAPPAAAPVVVRAAARPAYVKPMVPPLPTDVYQPSAQTKVQRRAAVPAQAPSLGKAGSDVKS